MSQQRGKLAQFAMDFSRFVKWAIRVAIAVVIIILIGSFLAYMYRDAVPAMYAWYASLWTKIFS
ncbi:MAG: hypothetical protein IKP28_01240 [Clostridia bacterium]|nr:hypothetical protein [Clostridia bacterium]